MQLSLTTDCCCHKFRQKTSPAQSSWQTYTLPKGSIERAVQNKKNKKNNASCKAVLSKPEVLTDQYCKAFLLMKQRCQTELKTSSFFKGDPILARPYCPWLELHKQNDQLRSFAKLTCCSHLCLSQNGKQHAETATLSPFWGSPQENWCAHPQHKKQQHPFQIWPDPIKSNTAKFNMIKARVKVNQAHFNSRWTTQTTNTSVIEPWPCISVKFAERKTRLMGEGENLSHF